MRKSISAMLLSLLSAPAFGQISLRVDLLDAGDGIPPPPSSIAVVDVLVDFADDRFWAGGGVVGRALSGTTLRYALDPNTDEILLTSPGLSDPFVTFFNRPRARNAPGRFTDGRAFCAGRFDPPGPTPIAREDELNIAFGPDHSSSAGTPYVDAAMFRVALNLPEIARFSPLEIIPADQTPGTGWLPLFESVGPTPSSLGGTVVGVSGNPYFVAQDWILGAYIPEPRSGALMLVAACVVAGMARR